MQYVKYLSVCESPENILVVIIPDKAANYCIMSSEIRKQWMIIIFGQFHLYLTGQLRVCDRTWGRKRDVSGNQTCDCLRKNIGILACPHTAVLSVPQHR